jgi:hypothetical protein
MSRLPARVLLLKVSVVEAGKRGSCRSSLSQFITSNRLVGTQRWLNAPARIRGEITAQREYDKVARGCARDGGDHPRYLLRLVELQLSDRERRLVERRIRRARFPA